MHAALTRLGVEGDCFVARGAPAPSIVEAARDTATDLLVIGTRGRSTFSRALLGSVAEAILHTAPCSVLVVHLAR
jgi:nucleotide-binding universal stress UspA family protein